EQKWSKRVQAPSPGLPFVRGSGRDVYLGVGDPGGDELLLVRLQRVGVLYRTAAHEADLDLFVERGRIGHLPVVDGFEVERRGRSGRRRRGGRSRSTASPRAT